MTLPTYRGLPGGAWTPAPEAPWAPPPVFLGDDIDATTGELRSLTRGIHPVDSWVITQIRTVRGSGSAVQDDGHRFGTFELVTDDAADIARAEVERMLRPAVERGDIEIVSVAAETMDGEDGVNVVVEWTNLRAGERRSAAGAERFVRT